MNTPADPAPDTPAEPEAVEPPDPATAAEVELFAQCVYCFDHQPPPQSPRAVAIAFVLSAALFVGAAFLQSPQLAVVLLLVIFIHELGHYAAMKWFGYRNVKLLFIPFFGGVVIGEKVPAPAWQQLVMLLLGPLPGIALAVGLFAALRPTPESWLETLVFGLLGVNALNLLPLVPLDGGRVVEILLFARHPVLTIAFRVLAVLGLVGLTWALSAWILLLPAALVALGIPAAYRFGVVARDFRRVHAGESLAPTLDDLDHDSKWAMFGWARTAAPRERNPWKLAAVMKRMYAEGVPGCHAGWGTMILAGLAYLGGFALTFLFFVLVITYAPAEDVTAGRDAIAPHLDRVEELNRAGHREDQVTALEELGAAWVKIRPPVRERLMEEFGPIAEWPRHRVTVYSYLWFYGVGNLPPQVTIVENGIMVTPPGVPFNPP
jgi:Zn-dependent protease